MRKEAFMLFLSILLIVIGSGILGTGIVWHLYTFVKTSQKRYLVPMAFLILILMFWIFWSITFKDIYFWIAAVFFALSVVTILGIISDPTSKGK